jgi:hypothetical protein
VQTSAVTVSDAGNIATPGTITAANLGTAAAAATTDFAAASHSHTVSDITNLAANYAPLSHTHAQNQVTGLTTALNAKEATANKGQANGYASLDSAGKVPVSQLPSSIMEYKGVWDADANDPELADGEGDPGDVYR